jgi:hypothetical protein
MPAGATMPALALPGLTATMTEVIMRRFLLFGPALFLLLLSGCPYEAKTPLGLPVRGSLDPRLLGPWTATNAQEKDTVRMLVLPFNDAEYYVELREKESRITRYRAYSVPLAGSPLLQINEIAPDSVPREFLLARYTFSPDSELLLRFIGQKIVPTTLAADARALAGFLAAHLADPDLDDEDVSLRLRPDGR